MQCSGVWPLNGKLNHLIDLVKDTPRSWRHTQTRAHTAWKWPAFLLKISSIALFLFIFQWLFYSEAALLLSWHTWLKSQSVLPVRDILYWLTDRIKAQMAKKYSSFVRYNVFDHLSHCYASDLWPPLLCCWPWTESHHVKVKHILKSTAYFFKTWSEQLKILI